MSNKIIKDAKINTSASNKKKSEPKRLQQTTGGASVGISARAVLLTIGAIVVILACIYVAYDQLREKVVMSVQGTNGTKNEYSLNDFGYYIYEGEATGETTAGFYKQYYGEDYDYWNAEMDDDGNTNAMMLADSIISESTKDFVLYQAAMDNGYEATQEDKDAAKKEADEATKAMTAKQKMITGLSNSDVYDVILKRKIAERYKADVITSLGVDYKEATKDITEKDYKQYDFEYYYVSTEGTVNEDGETVELTKDEIAAKKEVMDKFAKTVESAEDFSTIFGNDENGNPKTSNEDGVEYVSAGQMLVKDGFKNLDKQIIKMKVGEVSKVLEGEDGYYIIKMKDNTSTEAYDNAIQQAKDSADASAFDEEYSTNIEPNYTVDVDYDVWDNVAIGSYSI